MHHPMRRHKQALSVEDCAAALHRTTAGVLSISDDEYPYGVPLSFAYEEAPEAGRGILYFHSAIAGHKLEAMKAHPKVSFCVIDHNDIRPEVFTTAFRSVIVRGTARMIEEAEEKRHGLMALARKYSPGFDAEAVAEIDGSWNRTVVFALDIEDMSGKEGIELVRERR